MLYRYNKPLFNLFTDTSHNGGIGTTSRCLEIRVKELETDLLGPARHEEAFIERAVAPGLGEHRARAAGARADGVQVLPVIFSYTQGVYIINTQRI
jgi:hypothetical protein